MLNKLVARLIVRFFGTQTVDNVMGAFNKTLAELRNAEASRARIIASRIESIVSVDADFGVAKLASVG